MNAEARFLAAKARSLRLLAQSFQAEAEAARLDPWTPKERRDAMAAHAEEMAVSYLDMAAETEAEANV